MHLEIIWQNIIVSLYCIDVALEVQENCLTKQHESRYNFYNQFYIFRIAICNFVFIEHIQSSSN